MNIQRKSLSILAMAALSAAVVGCTHSQHTESGSATTDHGGMGHGTAEVGGMDHASMDLGPADATFDLRFLDGMILHHEGAVVMAEEALEKSSRDEILALSQDIISAQQTEIAQMQEWRQAWYPNAGDEPVMYHAEMNHDMPMSAEMAAMMRMDMPLGAADAEVDLRFINGMIPHHEGALEMAQEALEKSDRPELRALAEEILAVQQEEIDQMEAWRKEWYGQ